MEPASSPERGVSLPDFSGDKLTMLKQLSELAARRVPNDLWYSIEGLGNNAARTVSGLLDAHMYYEEGVRASGGEPVRFIDFVSMELGKLIKYEQRVEEMPINAINVEPEVAFSQTVQTASEVNKMIRVALSRRPKANRRQYSNMHHRSRR